MLRHIVWLRSPDIGTPSHANAGWRTNAMKTHTQGIDGFNSNQSALCLEASSLNLIVFLLSDQACDLVVVVVHGKIDW